MNIKLKIPANIPVPTKSLSGVKSTKDQTDKELFEILAKHYFDNGDEIFKGSFFNAEEEGSVL